MMKSTDGGKRWNKHFSQGLWPYGKGAMLITASMVVGGLGGALVQTMVAEKEEVRQVQAAGIPSKVDDGGKLRIQREGRALEQGNKPLGSERNLEIFARYICYKAVSNQGLCATVPVMVVNKPSVFAYATLALGSSYNRVENVSVGKAVLSMTPRRAAFLLAHEWTHGDVALITGNDKGYKDVARRAAFYFYRLDGKPMDTTLAMEAETDCLVYARSWVRWVEGYPGYLSQVGAVETTPRHGNDATTTCTYWKETLHGTPGMDYVALTPWIK